VKGVGPVQGAKSWGNSVNLEEIGPGSRETSAGPTCLTVAESLHIEFADQTEAYLTYLKAIYFSILNTIWRETSVRPHGHAGAGPLSGLTYCTTVDSLLTHTPVSLLTHTPLARSRCLGFELMGHMGSEGH